MLLIGFIACAFIGISLGLIGAGGSILTVPVLVFLFHLPPAIATSYSLFIVGVTSLNGAIGKYREGEMLLDTAFAFGLISMVVVVLFRWLLIPLIPEQLFSAGGIKVTYNWFSMSVFACLMIISSLSMITSGKNENIMVTPRQNLPGIIFCAILVGIITGLLGVGGGFLIIPALTLLLGVDIKKAIGTSLAVIAVNSLCGFSNDLRHMSINWFFLVSITLVSLAGCFSGMALSGHIDSKRLKYYFGWFVMALGVLIIGHQCLDLWHKAKRF